MALSIPSVPIFLGHLSGICDIVLAKLQMPHGTADSRAGRFTQKPHRGALKSVQMPHPRTTQKLHFLRNAIRTHFDMKGVQSTQPRFQSESFLLRSQGFLHTLLETKF